MRSFTPGPWELESRGWDGQFIYGQDERAHGRRFIAEVSLDYDGAEANARLIAAAPELLDALKDVISWVPGANAWHTDAPTKAVEKALAAIAKATGEPA